MGVNPVVPGLRVVISKSMPSPGGMLNKVLTVPTVDPHLAVAGVLGGDLVEQHGAGHGVLHAGRGDQHCEEKAECVGDDAPLPSDDLLLGVDALAGRGDAGGGLDALGVDHTGRRLRVPAFLFPQQLPE